MTEEITENKKPNKLMVALTKAHQKAKQQISIPMEITTQSLQAIQVIKMVRRQANEFCYLMDGCLDPSDLNESLVKVEMGLAYLKRADAEDRVQLLDDIIRELKSTRSIAKRMDARYEEETFQEEPQES